VKERSSGIRNSLEDRHESSLDEESLVLDSSTLFVPHRIATVNMEGKAAFDGQFSARIDHNCNQNLPVALSRLVVLARELCLEYYFDFEFTTGYVYFGDRSEPILEQGLGIGILRLLFSNR
jgi:hypothetical protein